MCRLLLRSPHFSLTMSTEGLPNMYQGTTGTFLSPSLRPKSVWGIHTHPGIDSEIRTNGELSRGHQCDVSRIHNLLPHCNLRIPSFSEPKNFMYVSHSLFQPLFEKKTFPKEAIAIIISIRDTVQYMYMVCSYSLHFFAQDLCNINHIVCITRVL